MTQGVLFRFGTMFRIRGSQANKELTMRLHDRFLTCMAEQVILCILLEEPYLGRYHAVCRQANIYSARSVRSPPPP
ncbi:hypothetical protein IMZ48_30795 [Candidatus Bathyarchaeota archaeon]|nr:hypothetical protein [Candidatus Bathyarchaeota archaeon]